MEKLKFKEIEKKMNEAVETMVIAETTEASYIKQQIFEKLKKEFKNLSEIDIHCNKIKMTFEYNHDYLEIENYDRGRVELIFSISTKRTDKIKKVTKTKGKYVHQKHLNPIKYKGYSIYSYVSSFDWKTDDISDLSITGEKWSHGNDHAKNATGETVEEIIESIKESYKESFKSDVVQPYLKAIVWGHGRRKEEIMRVLPEDLKKAIEERNNEEMFNKTRDYIVENKLYV